MGLALPRGFVESIGRRQAQSGHFILSTAPTVLDVRPSALPAAAAGPPLVASLCLGAAIAFALSLEYLAQPFVWRNWPAEAVLVGWLRLFVHPLTSTGPLAAPP